MRRATLGGGAALILFLTACTTVEYHADAVTTPLYDALDTSSVPSIVADAVWVNRPGDATEAFNTVGPGGPFVTVDGDSVTVFEFIVLPGDESTVSGNRVVFNLFNGKARSSGVLTGASVTIPRLIAAPADLTSDDIAPILETYGVPLDDLQSEAYVVDRRAGTLYRRVQAVVPAESLYIHLETGPRKNLNTFHWYIARYEDQDTLLAALADERKAADIAVALATRPAPTGDESEAVTTRASAIVVDSADEGESVTVSVPGGVYTGPVENGAPNGVGFIEYDDGRRYEGGFLNGRFDGRAVIRDGEGREMELTFRDGVPDGAGQFRFAEEAYEVRYDNGRRVDDRYLDTIVPQVEEIEGLRAEVTEKVRSGLPESAVGADLETLDELTAHLENEAGPARLLFEFEVEDQLVRFRVNDRGLVVSRYEELRVENDAGELLAVHRSGDTLAVTDSGAALRIQREEVAALDEPVTDARFLTAVGGGGFTVGDQYLFAGANAGFDYRYMNNGGEYLPGRAGGDGKGWDFRTAADVSADMQSIDGESDFTLSVAGIGSIGRTRYTFNRYDPDTLEQEGSGRTFGLQLIFDYKVIRPELPEGSEFLPDFFTRPLRIIPAPFISFENYRYNPGSASLESKTTTVQVTFGGGFGLYVTRTLVSF